MIPMRIVMMIIRWLLAAACIGVFIVSIRHGSERGFAGAAGLCERRSESRMIWAV
jgi:hypothetical protein